MDPLLTAIALSLAGSVGGLLVAAGLLLFSDGARRRIVPWLVSYAVGALLAASLVALLPEALELRAARQVFLTVLAAIFAFFVLEKLVLWRHCHTHDCDVHGTAAPLVLLGDAFHNFVDGAMIGAAVLTSFPLAVSTTIAVAAHEIPQEVGDFAILLHAGYSRKRAFVLNLVSGASAVAGAILAVLLVDLLPTARPTLLCIAAGSFLYIAMADLIPDLHSGRIAGGALRQLALMALGIATIVML